MSKLTINLKVSLLTVVLSANYITPAFAFNWSNAGDDGNNSTNGNSAYAATAKTVTPNSTSSAQTGRDATGVPRPLVPLNKITPFDFSGTYTLCNMTNEKISIKLDQPHNVKLKVPGAWNWDTKFNFIMEPSACDAIEVQVIKSVKLEYAQFGLNISSANNFPETTSMKIRSDPLSLGLAGYGWSPTEFKAYTLTPQRSSVYYQLIAYTTDHAYEKQNGSIIGQGLVLDMSLFAKANAGAASGGIIPLPAPNISTDRQIITGRRIDIGINYGQRGYEEVSSALSEAVNKGSREAFTRAPSSFVQGMSSRNGQPLDPKFKADLLSGMYNIGGNSSPMFTQVSASKAIINNDMQKNLTPQIVTSNTFENPSDKPILRNTNTYSDATTETTSSTLTHGWKTSNATELSGKAGVPFVAEGGVKNTFTVEYNGSKSTATTHTKTITYNVASQQIEIPAHSKVVVRTLLYSGTIKGTFTTQNIIENASVILNFGRKVVPYGTVYVKYNPYYVFANQDPRNISEILSLDAQTKQVALKGNGTYEITSPFETKLEVSVFPLTNNTGYSNMPNNISSQAAEKVYLLPVPLNLTH